MMKDDRSDSRWKKITQDYYLIWSDRLGKGSFGTVYKGYQLSTSRIIAVKFMNNEQLQSFPQYRRELDVMNNLTKKYHPNIMGYYGYVINNDGLFCFLEFCQGGSLKKFLEQKVSESKVLTLFKQLLDAMAYINAENIVHRDLKPDNILLDENQDLKIADFGMARDVGLEMSKERGTLLYSAPQMLNNQPYNDKCDVWSAGLILYEMLNGKRMYDVKHIKDLYKEIEIFSQPDHKIKMPSEELDPEWEIIISKMMTYNPAKRPTFQQMKEYFEKVGERMSSDIKKKYGPGIGQKSQLLLTKSISPYQSNFPQLSKNKKLIDIARRLQEQKSFNKLNNLRKFLRYSRMKAEFLLKLLKQFYGAQYLHIKNVHKYILMFLSVSAYISTLEVLSLQLKAKSIKIPEEEINKQEICEKHFQTFCGLINESLKSIQTSINKFGDIFEKKIISKIVDTYMKRQEERKILEEYEQLIALIVCAKNGEYVAQEKYLALFRKVIYRPGVHLKMEKLKQLKSEDVKVYAYILLIAHLDECFSIDHYKHDDYIRSKKQDFENASKQKHLEFIKKYN